MSNLRKEKAAKLKLNILDNTIKLIGKKSFDEIFVDEICEKVRISKVTLFKYFPQKEDLLLYYFRLWCFKRTIELKHSEKEGVAGIYFLFERLGESYESNPGIMLSLIGYLADLKRQPKPFPVKAEEKKLLYPEMKEAIQVEILSLDQMIDRFILEAIFRKEITKTSATKDLNVMVTSLFFGSVLAAHLQQPDNLKYFFRRTIEMGLKGLQ